MSLSTKLKVVLTVGVLAGAGLAAPMSAQASDFDNEFGPSYHRPRVERQVTVTTTVTRRYVSDQPVYGRPVYDDDDHEPGYRRRYFERRPIAQPIFYGRPVYGRPIFDDHDECRVIIKKRVYAWGDVVVKRIKRCD